MGPDGRARWKGREGSSRRTFVAHAAKQVARQDALQFTSRDPADTNIIPHIEDHNKCLQTRFRGMSISACSFVTEIGHVNTTPAQS